MGDHLIYAGTSPLIVNWSHEIPEVVVSIGNTNIEGGRSVGTKTGGGASFGNHVHQSCYAVWRLLLIGTWDMVDK